MNKIIYFCLLNIFTIVVHAQLPPKNWQLLDYKNDGVLGMSVEKAKRELLKDLKPKQKVIVAVIDVGIDISHPAFKNAIWTNQKEIPENGIDDDGNGYVDDVNGWNFAGDCEVESYDCVREYVKFKNTYENSTDTLNLNYKYWKEMKRQKDEFMNLREGVIKRTEPAITALKMLNSYWKNAFKTDSIFIKDIIHKSISTHTDTNLINAQIKILPLVFRNDTLRRNKSTLTSVIDGYQSVVDFYKGEYEVAQAMIDHNDVNWFRKKSPGDDPYTNSNIYYGNGIITPAIPHGNGVSGIIAAAQTDSGIKGIADWVEIMTIKIVTSKVIGDERDKDAANAIRYAVNNGAKIINYSIGKQNSPQKELVDDAVRYAEKKGVLIFTAAGNDALDNDSVKNYISPTFSDGSKATNLFTIGASTWTTKGIWEYSNYGKNTVDFFAPGADIYSTALHGEYNRTSGTSYAAPSTGGLAALIWNYYPQLNYKQVMQCIEQSVEYSDLMVTKPSTKEKVLFKTLSRFGGIINAYNALKIANQIH